MTPLETEVLQRLGTNYLQVLEKLAISVFFYGASSFLVDGISKTYKFDKRTLRCTFHCVGHYLHVRFSSLPVLARPNPPSFHRRRGFSNRATAAMFMMTIINFLLSSLNTGTGVAAFVVFVRKALILDIEYPLSEKPELVNNALQNLNIIIYWTDNLPVSSSLSLLVSVSIYARWRYYSAISLSFGGLGPSSNIGGG